VHEIDVEVARWLVSPPGLDAVAQATARLDAGAEPLTVAAELRGRGTAPERGSAVLAAATARRRARHRWPDADRLLFTREGLEQASDPEVSRWRARRLAVGGREVLDLCAGIGGDTLALAALGASVIAVDQDPGRLELLAHNARACDLDVITRVDDARRATASPDTWVHADPGRRRDGRRVRVLRDHLPPVPDLVDRFGDAPAMGIVLSPAIDLDDRDLPDGELEFVQLGNSLVEAVVWLGGARDGSAMASSTLLPDGVHLVRRQEPQVLATGPVGTHLVEVVPAAVRARLHDELGRRIGAHRLAANRALLTTAGPPPGSSWYRARPVETVLPAHPRAVRRWLRSAPERPLEVVLHGVAGSTERWWRELGRPPRGPSGRRIELVRTEEGAIAVVTLAVGDVRGDGQGTV
jgi:hypothetical protein